MTKISIITAVGRGSELLAVAAQSVAALQSAWLREGVKLEWILASDGPPVDLIENLVSGVDNTIVLPPVLLAPTTVGRASIARNRALAVSSGDWVGCMDDDDYLLEAYRSLNPDLLSPEGEYRWLAGSYNMLMEGALLPPATARPFVGVQTPGTFREYLLSEGRQPFVGSAGIVEAELLYRLGGWPVMAYHQDTQLWLNITENAKGYTIADSVYGWRRHPDQMTPMDTTLRPKLWR